MIGRNYTDTGELVTSNNLFVTGKEAVKQKAIRFLRKMRGEDVYNRTNGIDLSNLMQLASNQESLFARHVSDYLKDNMPEIDNVISVNIEKTNESSAVNVKLILETEQGVIEI